MSRVLMTPDAFLAWERANDSLLQDLLDENQRRVDDEVIRFVMDSLHHGATKRQAGDAALKLLIGKRGGAIFTPEGITRSLRSIGWTSARECESAGSNRE